MAVRSVLVALLGIAVAGASAYAARDYINTQTAAAKLQAAPVNDLVTIVVAVQDIPFGGDVGPQMLKLQTWPREALPIGAFTQMDEVVHASGEPRRAKYAVPRGMPILASMVSGFGEKVTLVQALGPNRRAMAISVDATTAVGGFVTPGDKVDVLLTEGVGDALRTITILQDIKVLGVDQQSDQQMDTPGVARTVTVEVTPGDGQKLALAQKAGTLSLSLRTMTDVANADLDYTTLKDLVREQPVPAATTTDAPPPPPKRTTIIVRKAGASETVEVN